MKIAFRVDASGQIGTGHFMRCLTLADELKQNNAQISFVSRELPMHLRDMLAARGLELASLGSDASALPTDDLAHAHWLGTSQEQDAKATIEALADGRWDWLIVDHYALDARWESALRRTAKHIMVIDDIADRQHDCDLLLDQNFYANMESRYIGKVPPHCQLLLGPRYALLREEFKQLHEQVKPRTGTVKRILIFFGGVDTDNYTAQAIEAIAGIGSSEPLVDVVIGAQHPYRAEIEAACAEHKFACHVQTNRMAELMAAADLAIGAGGSATWERCCLGLPTLAFSMADNQHMQIADAALKGLLYAPEIKDDLNQTIQRHARALIENSHLRQFISFNTIQAVDGRGVLRIIRNMGCNGIEIRNARPDDSELLYVWRNHPAIRVISRNADGIKWEDHCNWLASVLSDQNRLLLVGELDGAPIGVVRFDIQNHQAEVSIYLDPGANNSGRGHDLLKSAEQWFSLNHPGVNILRAHVLGANERSQHLFLAAEYEVETITYSKRVH